MVEARVLAKDENIDAVRGPRYSFGRTESSTSQRLIWTGCTVRTPSRAIPPLVPYRAVDSGGENVHVVDILHYDAGSMQTLPPQADKSAPPAAIPGFLKYTAVLADDEHIKEVGTTRYDDGFLMRYPPQVVPCRQAGKPLSAVPKLVVKRGIHANREDVKAVGAPCHGSGFILESAAQVLAIGFPSCAIPILVVDGRVIADNEEVESVCGPGCHSPVENSGVKWGGKSRKV